MSYDILFESADEAEPRPPDQRTWEQIVTGARAIFGDDITTDAADGSYELVDEPTAIQLTCDNDLPVIIVPYWFTGADAESILAQMYELGWLVETATGLTGYDPQRGLPLAEAASEINRGVAIFDRTAEPLARIQES
jgi:hypothetical protein